MKADKPHVLMVIPRGEAVRNFLYSDTLRLLADRARITLLSVIHDDNFRKQFGQYASIVPLKDYPEKPLVTGFRYLLHNAHFRWIWSEAAKYHWNLHDARARTILEKIRRTMLKALAFPLANRPTLEMLTKIDESLSWYVRPTNDFGKLFAELEPDLVFNCSHIHGPQADLPMRIAKRMGIPTAAFIFSWDNLTSRSRVFVPYDYYLMWNKEMKEQLLGQYPKIKPEQVYVTGTPQFDFHFNRKFVLPRQELCTRIGLDPERPFVLYSTGMDTDFQEEHRIVEAVIGFLKEDRMNPKPQLVVRTYVKGTTPEMMALGQRGIADVVFPPILWDKQWIMPLHEDLYIYTSLLHHCALGINAASTVSLELMMLDKPVINLGFEPPGSKLPYWSRFSRHVEYEHYRPVAGSGAVMVASSMEDLRAMVVRGLREPQADRGKRDQCLKRMFGNTLDGNSGQRIAAQILALAGSSA